MSEVDLKERVATLETKLEHLEKSQEEIKGMVKEVRDALLAFRGVKGTLLIVGAFLGFLLTKGIALFPYLANGK